MSELLQTPQDPIGAARPQRAADHERRSTLSPKAGCTGSHIVSPDPPGKICTITA
jgi:hypothetical protein